MSFDVHGTPRVDLESAFAFRGQDQQSTITFKVCWISEVVRKEFLVACSLGVTSAFSKLLTKTGDSNHFSVKAALNIGMWDVSVTRVVPCTPIWLALGESWMEVQAPNLSRSCKNLGSLSQGFNI